MQLHSSSIKHWKETNRQIQKERKTDPNVMKQIKKENLPAKICVVCNRPFNWRKKWEKVWDQVKYCSDKCRMNKSKTDILKK